MNTPGVSNRSLAKRLYCQMNGIFTTEVRVFDVEDGVWFILPLENYKTNLPDYYGFVVDTSIYPDIKKEVSQIPVLYKDKAKTRVVEEEQHFVLFDGVDSFKVLWLSLAARQIYLKFLEKQELFSEYNIVSDDALRCALERTNRRFLEKHPIMWEMNLKELYSVYSLNDIKGCIKELNSFLLNEGCVFGIREVVNYAVGETKGKKAFRFQYLNRKYLHDAINVHINSEYAIFLKNYFKSKGFKIKFLSKYSAFELSM